MAQLERPGKSALNLGVANPLQRASMAGLPAGSISAPVLCPGVKPMGQSSWPAIKTCRFSGPGKALTRVKDTFAFSGAGSAAWRVFAETKPKKRIPKQKERPKLNDTDRINAELLIRESFATGKSLSMEKPDSTAIESVRRFETNKGACADPRAEGSVVTNIHERIFSHGGSDREAVGVDQLGHHIGAIVPTLYRREVVNF